MEILPQAAGRDFREESDIGGRDHPDIEGDRFAAAGTLDLALLQPTQHLPLCGTGQ